MHMKPDTVTWEAQASMMFCVPLTFTSCISFLLAVLAAAGAAVAQWNTTSHPAAGGECLLTKPFMSLLQITECSKIWLDYG